MIHFPWTEVTSADTKKYTTSGVQRVQLCKRIYEGKTFTELEIKTRFVSFLSNLVIASKLIPFQIFVILNSFNTLPYPMGEKNGHRRLP